MKLKLVITVFTILAGIHYSNAQENQKSETGMVKVTVKRDRGFYGSWGKWPVFLVDGKTYREMEKGYTKYLYNNNLGKLGKRSYFVFEIPANVEKLLCIGSHFFFINASDQSEMTINLAGIKSEVEVCNGTAEVGIGFQADEYMIYNIYESGYEEFSLENLEPCLKYIDDLANFTKVTLK